MKRHTLRGLKGTVCAVLCALAGISCVSVNYRGISEPPLPHGAPVAIYYAKDQIKSSYRVIGRGTYTAAPDTTRAEIRQIFADAARAHGANAILITRLERVKDYTAREDQILNENTPEWNVEDNSHSARNYVFNTIYYSSGNDPEKTVYKTFIEADFLVTENYTPHAE